MDKEQLKQKILQLLPEAKINDSLPVIELTVPQDKLHTLAKSLKIDNSTSFDYLYCQTGVDWVDKLSVVYHLQSTKHNHSIVLKVYTENRENPVIDSVYDIWRTAEYHEREIFDLFGIRFNNHPDMRRLFLDEGWNGYPLRKDYIDEINMIEFR
jgi:NADH-quinone oxidoreductase subunit C